MSARWDNHFLRLAQVHAELSKDPNTRVAALAAEPAGEREGGAHG